MPRYEITVLTRVLQTPQVESFLINTSEYLLNKDGFILKFENLGEAELFNYVLKDKKFYSRGHWLLFDVVAPIKLFKNFHSYVRKDPFVLKINTVYLGGFGPHVFNKNLSCSDTSWTEETLRESFRPKF
ncbi:28S ribosomal protein S6, mitochondrial [Thelohanellus kitauei]|uniref:Small ribosomal subunit protein bS6m n=1 Tax=Thelohanellus kitauei TaxID=669202 RepID=A0A0C2IAP0_THEKT|nr:28S ribosomal protein S6, mitochondrial [Thelohanellus kitauei]